MHQDNESTEVAPKFDTVRSTVFYFLSIRSVLMIKL